MIIHEKNRRIQLGGQRLTTLAALLLAVIALAGCEADTSDLDRYFEEVKSRPGGKIEPIPKLKTFEVFVYEAQERRSPFKPDERSLALGTDTGVDGPDLARNREPLEEFPLDSLRMVGTLAINGRRYALVRDSEGIVHRVSVGDHMGRNFGRIVAISDAEIQLREKVPNGLGGWTERGANLALSEQS